MDVGEDELDDIVRQRLHLPIYAEPMTVDLLILFRLFEIQRVKSLGNGVVLAQGLFTGHNRKTFPRAKTHNQQLMFRLFRRVYTVDLPSLKDHAILTR